MGYSKNFIGILTLFSALSCGVLFANYGIVDAVDSIDTPSISDSGVAHSFPAALSLNLVRRHLLVANSPWSSYTGSIVGPVDYIKMLEDGIRFDVIHELEFVDNKALYLSGYISAITDILDRVDGYTTSLQDTIALKKAERLVCIDQKKQADENFFDSLAAFDQTASDRALQDSMAAGSCEESTRISIAANTVQLRRITQLHGILSSKQVLLVKNTAMIVSYFPLIKKELLQQLLILSSQLQNYTTSLDR